MKNIRNSMSKVLQAVRFVRSQKKPSLPTLYYMKKLNKEEELSLLFLTNTNYLERPEDYITFQRYEDSAAGLNDLSLEDALDIKTVLFRRMPSFMKRRFIDVEKSSEKEIRDFIARCGKVIGKRNLSCGKGLVVYRSGELDEKEKLKDNHVAILEEYIEQHPEYAAMNRSSVNTIRIHTLRTTLGSYVVLYPKLRVGSSGSITDLDTGSGTSYRVLLDHDGIVLGAYRIDQTARITACCRHEETGYLFSTGSQLPFVKEAEELCTAAAEMIPEERFIGWDVAITEKGPIIVEANNVSGAIQTYQLIHFLKYGRGNGNEIREILKTGLEDAINEDNNGLKACCFADLRYLSDKTATPDSTQQFLLLLQTALHAHGVDFYLVDRASANCRIEYREESRSILFGKKEIREVRLPNEIPEIIYEADKQARKLAREIFAELSKME